MVTSLHKLISNNSPAVPVKTYQIARRTSPVPEMGRISWLVVGDLKRAEKKQSNWIFVELIALL